MTTAVANTVQLPAHLLDFAGLATDINAGITGGIKVSSGHPRIGIKASKWRIEENGVEELHQSFTLDVIIVDTNRNISKVFYAGKYNPQATEFTAPDCLSDNGVGPSANSSAPQCATCATCPNNVWGSRINELGNKSKACQDYKKLAVILADDPARNVYELRVPAASLQAFNELMTRIVSSGIPIPSMVFRLSFDPSVDYPKLVFKPVQYINEDQKEQVVKWMSRPESKEAVGANDKLHQGASVPVQNASAVNQHTPIPQSVGEVPRVVRKEAVQQEPTFQMPSEPAPEKPKSNRGRPPKNAGQVANEEQLSLDLAGTQAAAQATVIAPVKASPDLDAILAGILP